MKEPRINDLGKLSLSVLSERYQYIQLILVIVGGATLFSVMHSVGLLSTLAPAPLHVLVLEFHFGITTTLVTSLLITFALARLLQTIVYFFGLTLTIVVPLIWVSYLLNRPARKLRVWVSRMQRRYFKQWVIYGSLIVFVFWFDYLGGEKLADFFQVLVLTFFSLRSVVLYFRPQ